MIYEELLNFTTKRFSLYLFQLHHRWEIESPVDWMTCLWLHRSWAFRLLLLSLMLCSISFLCPGSPQALWLLWWLAAPISPSVWTSVLHDLCSFRGLRILIFHLTHYLEAGQSTHLLKGLSPKNRLARGTAEGLQWQWFLLVLLIILCPMTHAYMNMH